MAWATATLTQARGYLAATSIADEVLFGGGTGQLAEVYGDKLAGSSTGIFSTTIEAYQIISKITVTKAITLTGIVLDSIGVSTADPAIQVIGMYYSEADAIDNLNMIDGSEFQPVPALGGSTTMHLTGSPISLDAGTYFISISVDNTSGSISFDMAETIGYSAIFSTPYDPYTVFLLNSSLKYTLLVMSDSGDLVDIYNTVSGLWSTATLSQVRSRLAGASANGKAMFGGGQHGFTLSNTVDIYDGTTWTTSTLSQSRSFLAAAGINGKIVFGGGYNDADFETPSNTVDIYDTTSDMWTTSTLSQARSALASAGAGNKLLFGGGSSPSTSNIVDIYDTDTNSWVTATLSQARSYLAAAGSNNKILFGGGRGVTYSNVVDIYNVDTNSWSTATLAQARYALTAVAIGDKILFGGGSYSDGRSYLVDIYDTILDTWSTATLSQARMNLASAEANGRALFGGGLITSNVVDIYTDVEIPPPSFNGNPIAPSSRVKAIATLSSTLIMT